MPEIKCEHGHTMRIGTKEWIVALILRSPAIRSL